MNPSASLPTSSPVLRPGSIQRSYRLKAVQLSSAVIVNLREDRNPALDSNARDLLRAEEIRYFRQNGNNTVIFIHGFNVEYGTYSRHVELSQWGFDILRNRPMDPKLIYSTAPATIYRDQQALKNQYASWHTHYPELFDTVDLENLNGTGAHAWYLHMEDNLNRATGQFNRTDYRKYTRIIHVAWSGDVHPVNYMEAETHANKAGFGLARLIDQLVAEGISVNLIAHSLGNRVLLVAMNQLGQMPGRSECIANAFMWQPAIPDTALSNDPNKDTSVLRNWNFIHAHRAAKKIVVLYSNRDNILGPHVSEESIQEDLKNGEYVEAYTGRSYKIWGTSLEVDVPAIYQTATRVGVPGKQLLYAPWSVSALYSRNLASDNLPKIEDALREEVAKDTNGLFTNHLVPLWPEKVLSELGALLYMRHISGEMADDAMKTFRALARAEYEDREPRPAMGYGGPDWKNDRFIQRLIQEKKIELINQTPWLPSHSGMKIPDEVLFEKVYEDRIMKRILSDTGFGRWG